MPHTNRQMAELLHLRHNIGGVSMCEITGYLRLEARHVPAAAFACSVVPESALAFFFVFCGAGSRSGLCFSLQQCRVAGHRNTDQKKVPPTSTKHMGSKGSQQKKEAKPAREHSLTDHVLANGKVQRMSRVKMVRAVADDDTGESMSSGAVTNLGNKQHWNMDEMR